MVAFTTFVQEATAMKRLLLGIVAGVALSACGDPEAVEITPWDVGENYTLAYKKGIYKAKLVILEDTCTPSLQSIVDGAINWPSPYTVAPVSQAGYSFGTYAQNIRALRPTFVMRYPTRLNKVRPGDAVVQEVARFNLEAGELTRYCEGLDSRDYKSTTTFRVLSEDVFEFETDDRWLGFESCDAEEARRKHAWFPNEPCRERYKIVYTIDEEVDNIQRLDFGVPSCLMSAGDIAATYIPVDPLNDNGFNESAYYRSWSRDGINVQCMDF
jgi:hypothetical protein